MSGKMPCKKGIMDEFIYFSIHRYDLKEKKDQQVFYIFCAFYRPIVLYSPQAPWKKLYAKI